MKKSRLLVVFSLFVSSIAQASVVPTSGASFVTLDSSLLNTSAYQHLENPTSLVTPYGVVSVSGDGNDAMLSLPNGVGFWALGSLRLVFGGFNFHQVFFEIIMSGPASDLVVAGISGVLDIPDSGGSTKTYPLDIYSPTALSGLTFNGLHNLISETSFTTGTVFFSNSIAPLYGNSFTEFSPVAPIPEPTPVAVLSGALIAVLFAKRKTSG